MTREELEQIYYLHRELRMWEQELERLRCRSLVRSPQPNTGNSSGTSDKVGELAERRVDLERRIELKREEIQQRRDEAIAFIYDIPDSLTRQIVYYRCVSLFGWTRVAYEVGGNNSPDGVRKIYSRFMEKM